MRYVTVMVCGVLLAAPVVADDLGRRGWGRDAGDPRTQELVDSLRDLIRDAKRRRAADPWLMDELRTLARRYYWPWRRRIFYDDFADGDYTHNPAWTVVAGRFGVARGRGLRSFVRPAAARHRPKRTRPEDLPLAILRGVLEQQQGGGRRDRAPEPGHAEIFVAREISNAFAIRLELRSQEPHGQLEFGPYSGPARDSGYRLVYAPGPRPTLELVRASPRGRAVIETAARLTALEDGRSHQLEWTRDRRGRMAVSLDGERLFEVTDRADMAAFSGFVLVNHGGDYDLGRILVSGAG